jgi:hypothetical protein
MLAGGEADNQGDMKEPFPSPSHSDQSPAAGIHHSSIPVGLKPELKRNCGCKPVHCLLSVGSVSAHVPTIEQAGG